jgi:tetratricopeptide (TPR) repeat protein
MAGRLTWLLIGMVGFAVALQPAYADDQSRDGAELNQALANLSAVCQQAWTFDNLRPTVSRAVWPGGTIFNPPQVPVVHLSPGCPQYRWLVGEMAYWGTLYTVGNQRLKLLADPALAGADEPTKQKARRITNDLVGVKAHYRRACAWAWCFTNLRPLVREPGFTPDTIINPLIPVPDTTISPASPDSKAIVQELSYWEAEVDRYGKELKDLLDRQAAKAKAAKPQPLQPPPPQDHRLARMFEIRQQLQNSLSVWRDAEENHESFARPWRNAKEALMRLEHTAADLQSQIATAQLLQNGAAPGLQANLAQVTSQIALTRQMLTGIEMQVEQAKQLQWRLSQDAAGPVEEWVSLCDLFGRMGPKWHQKELTLLDQWILDEPDLWQQYLARGIARLNVGRRDQTQAIEDLKVADRKASHTALAPKASALVTAVEAYALCKGDNVREGNKRFAGAVKLDPQFWTPYFIRGWSKLFRGSYPEAKADFQIALRLSRTTPKAEAQAQEAMAFLLAACPRDSVRDGEKAVEHANKANDLSKGKDWVCLDTLGAAYAELGDEHKEAADFDTAAKWASRALQVAPVERQESLSQRIALYQEKRPYRLR